MMVSTETTGIRVAVLVHGELLQWQAGALRGLSDLGVVVPAAIVRSAGHDAVRSSVLDAMPAMEVTGLPPAWADAPRTDHGHDPQATAVWLARHRPDVLLVFGKQTVASELASVPVHGAWAFHFGPPGAGYPVPVLFEAIAGEPLAHAFLIRLPAATSAPAVLRQAVVGVDGDVLQLMPALLELVLRWPADVLREVGATGAVRDAGAWSGTERPAPPWPGRAALLSFRFKRWLQRMRLWRRPMVEQGEWNIGVLQQPLSDLLDPEGSRGVRWLPAPSASGSRATPFGYLHEGRLNVLFEKSNAHEGAGVIARLRPRPDNVLKRSRTMLDIGRPITYPYIVEHEGAVYVVLDHPTDGNVVLYRVNDGNDGLDRVATLIDEPMAGATLFQYGGRWWLLGTRIPHPDALLYAYWSDRIEGPFVPHKQNPVKTDVRSARPAGTPFVHEGRLWRPAQDRTPGARVQVVFNEVIELTPERFHETPMERLGLFAHTAYAKGMRTVSAVGGVTVVDGLRDRLAASKPSQRKKKGERSGKGSNQES